MLEISAPGKLILCGEHAVVYGKKALACAIDLRTRLIATKNESSQRFELNLADLNTHLSIDEHLYASYLSKYAEQNTNTLIEVLQNDLSLTNTLKTLVFLFRSLHTCLKWPQLSGQSIEIKSEIPLAAGLGSSAAFSVCISAYFLLLSNQITKDPGSEANLARVNECAFNLEKIFHGRPSGIDNSVSTHGNYVLFEKGRGFLHISFLLKTHEEKVKKKRHAM